MEKVVIAAVSENGVIGKNGDIPWYFPEDLKHFKEKTLGHPVVMGRKTYESLPEDYKPLPDRTNIVLTRSEPELDESVETANSLEEAWKKARSTGKDKLFIAGGSKVYEQTLDDADKIVLTRIHDHYEGDSFFPEFDREDYELVSEDDQGEMSFLEYVRKD